MFTLASKLQSSRTVKMLLCVTIIFFLFVFFNLNRNLPQEKIGEKDYGSSSSNISTKTDLIVDVYYECLCPDSRYFVVNQLVPAWQKLGPIFTINFWPYGKATSTVNGDGYSFDCQHGPMECEGNIYHACGVNKIEDPDIRIQYVSCMISNNMNPPDIASSCARKLGVSFPAIEACARSTEGQKLHYIAGKKTGGLTPRLSFVPTIEVDSSQRNQRLLLKNFLREVCVAYKEKSGQSTPECESHL